MPIDSNTTRHESREQTGSAAARGDGGRSLAFWMLVALSLALLTPAVLLPSWRAYQAAELRHRLLARRVESLTADLQKQEHLLEALHSDPAVVMRAAKRELDYTQPGQQFVSITTRPIEALESSDPQKSADVKPLPIILQRFARFLPRWDYDSLFCRSPIREVLMAMSASLLIASFAIFWPRRRADRSPAAC